MNIKKSAVAFLIAGMLLSGCSQSGTQVDGQYVVASIKNGDTVKNIFADDLYQNVISQTSNKTTVFNAVLQNLINKKFPIDEDMQTEADTIIDQIKTYYESQYGEEYETTLNEAITSSGYADIVDYRIKMIQQIQYANFLLDYINKNYDAVFDDYYKQANPKEASIIKISMVDVNNPTDEEKAKLKEVKTLLTQTDKSFGDIAQDYSDDATASNKGKIGLYDLKDTNQIGNTYGEDVVHAIQSLEEGKVSSQIKGEDGIYFVKVTNTDYDKIKKSLQDTDIDSPLLVYDDYIQYVVYDSYKLSYKDKDIEKIVNEVIDHMLSERQKERGEANE